ncbi:MAG TPA: type II toxin-antitoxin system Phd/YefM family antitoxin [Acidobacteriota bacterium]|jgi:antitoxin (DNA-binding transcriptional repressor) of toxin-antitoxin stability system
MTGPKTMTVTEFKAKCLKILDELDAQGLIVTKRGKPIARVAPILAEQNRSLIGSMKTKIKVKGNIFSTGAKWNVKS